MNALSRRLRQVRPRLAFARLGDAAFVGVAAAGAVGAGVAFLGISWGWAVAVGVAGFAAMWRPAPSLPATAAWLDERHGLNDLLASAWMVRTSTGPWADTLRSMADARAAALPPLGRLARFSVRHHACVLAAAAAAVLVGRVIVPTSAVVRPADDALAVVDAPGERATVRHVAAEVRRAADTADSGTGLPSPAAASKDSSANAPPRPARSAGDAAQGSGRADTDRVAALPAPPSASTDSTAVSPGPAGSGRPATAGGEGSGGGRVVRAPASTVEPISAASASADHNDATRTQATPVPAAYRDLVRDYFAK